MYYKAYSSGGGGFSSSGSNGGDSTIFTTGGASFLEGAIGGIAGTDPAVTWKNEGHGGFGGGGGSVSRRAGKH